MEALEFLQCYYAMCYHRHSPNGCGDCKAQEIDCELTTDYPEKLVEAVERWAKAHPEEAADATKPKRTNKDVLLAAFPNAYILYPGGIPMACPLSLDKHYDCSKFKNCAECGRAYWLAEVEA